MPINEYARFVSVFMRSREAQGLQPTDRMRAAAKAWRSRRRGVNTMRVKFRKPWVSDKEQKDIDAIQAKVKELESKVAAMKEALATAEASASACRDELRKREAAIREAPPRPIGKGGSVTD